MKKLAAYTQPETDIKASIAHGPDLLTAIVDGVDTYGRPRISWHNGPTKPVVAEVVWMAQEVDWNRCPGINVIIGFMEANPERPIILGLLTAPPPIQAEAESGADSADEQPAPPKVLRFESTEEIILECGKSKIMLRADGRITLLGGSLVSEATGTNKIRGGSVQIN
jgi:hypothetical protein